jgi:hypothetical protein
MRDYCTTTAGIHVHVGRTTHVYRPIARDVTGRAQWAALEDNWSGFLWRKCTEAAFAARYKEGKLPFFSWLQYVRLTTACFGISHRWLASMHND